MKWFLATLAACALWLGGVAAWIAAGPTEDPADTAEVAIVLGAAVDYDVPSPVFAARIDHAVALHQSGRVAEILFTGGQSPEDAKSESLAAKDYAIAKGIPASAILTEDVSRTTRQNLVEAQKVMASHGRKGALIVSDPLHLQRASQIAESLGMPVKASATPVTRYRSWSTKGPFLLRELYFMHHHWVFGE